MSKTYWIVDQYYYGITIFMEVYNRKDLDCYYRLSELFYFHKERVLGSNYESDRREDPFGLENDPDKKLDIWKNLFDNSDDLLGEVYESLKV